jgi:type I restriction enzyme R subunit
VLYSVPYAERLTYRDVKDLAETLSRPPQNWTPDRLWAAYDQLDRDKVRGSGERILTDIVSLVRYALEQDDELVPFRDRVKARFEGWLAMQEQTGPEFTEEQRRWLLWMRDHIATSMGIDADALNLPPFVEEGGIGKAVQVFGDRLGPLMNELSEVLAA